MPELYVDPDIRRASSLPPEVYRDPASFRAQVESVLRRTWHLVADAARVAAPGDLFPVTLLPGSLDEPLLLSRDAEGRLHALSNVCTHRGNLLVHEPCRARGLRCRYHGRRFELDGRFVSMPETEGAIGFPSPADDLPRAGVATLGPLVLASLEPAFPFDEAFAPIRERLAFVPWERLAFDPETSRDYEVRAHWALYCDNYLEGFHIPFVHAGLASALDWGAYTTETFELASLQIGVAAEGEPEFELPPSHPDRGKRIAAYYLWLFPTTMLNVYPWGVSVNAVRPIAPDRTVVSFLSYVADPTKRTVGAGADLHRVELEDEAIVEAVQQGVRSRLYRAGRFSPSREVGVHHFHRLLARFLGGGS